MCIFDTIFDFTAPNFWALFVSIVLIPTIIILWNKRSKNGFHGIEIKLSKGSLYIDNTPNSSGTLGTSGYPGYDDSKSNQALKINFNNQTDSVITIRNPRLIRCTKNFPINNVVSTRDITDFSFELKFLNQNNQYEIKEIKMSQGQNNTTGISLNENVDEKAFDEILTYHPNIFRRWIRCRKYFIIEFYLIKGNKWYHIKKSY